MRTFSFTVVTQYNPGGASAAVSRHPRLLICGDRGAGSASRWQMIGGHQAAWLRRDGNVSQPLRKGRVGLCFVMQLPIIGSGYALGVCNWASRLPRSERRRKTPPLVSKELRSLSDRARAGTHTRTRPAKLVTHPLGLHKLDPTLVLSDGLPRKRDSVLVSALRGSDYRGSLWYTGPDHDRSAGCVVTGPQWVY